MDSDETAGFRRSANGTEAPPARVGAYIIKRPLAAGGFGTVYTAEHAERGAPAAIKVMHVELAANPDAVARFAREIEILTRVRHPSVVEVHDWGQLPDGRPYFAMELLQGVSLKEHLDERSRLPAREALEILEQICGALTAAHALAIVHRDIKASNVFLCDAPAGGGEAGRPARRMVLLDFGVAKLLDNDGPGLTTSRHVIGTIACMAPEQLRSRPVDARTDVYALGALAYRMLTGEPLFSARNAISMQQMHLHAAPQPPSLIAPIDPAFDAPILRALSKAPDARQQSAAAFFAEMLAAAAERRAGEQRGALAVMVEVLADPEVMAAPDEALLDDLEAVLPAAVGALEAAGLRLAVQTGTSALLSTPRPDEAGEDARTRRGALIALGALVRRLAGRAGRDPRVRVRASAHVGRATIGPDGAIAGGELMQLASWVPDLDAAGVVASAEALAGLDLPARAAGEAHGITWLELAG